MPQSIDRMHAIADISRDSDLHVLRRHYRRDAESPADFLLILGGANDWTSGGSAHVCGLSARGVVNPVRTPVRRRWHWRT